MAGSMLESALLTVIMLVLVAPLSVGFASRLASAALLLLLVETAAAASIELGATVPLRAIGFCQPYRLRRRGGTAVHRGNGASLHLFLDYRPPHRRRPAPTTRPRHRCTPEQPVAWATCSSNDHCISARCFCFSRIADQCEELFRHHLTTRLPLRGRRM